MSAFDVLNPKLMDPYSKEVSEYPSEECRNSLKTVKEEARKLAASIFPQKDQYHVQYIFLE